VPEIAGALESARTHCRTGALGHGVPLTGKPGPVSGSVNRTARLASRQTRSGPGRCDVGGMGKSGRHSRRFLSGLAVSVMGCGHEKEDARIPIRRPRRWAKLERAPGGRFRLTLDEAKSRLSAIRNRIGRVRCLEFGEVLLEDAKDSKRPVRWFFKRVRVSIRVVCGRRWRYPRLLSVSNPRTEICSGCQRLPSRLFRDQHSVRVFGAKTTTGPETTVA